MEYEYEDYVGNEVYEEDFDAFEAEQEEAAWAALATYVQGE